MTHKRGNVRRKSDVSSITVIRGCCELGNSTAGRIHNAGCIVEETLAKYHAAVQSCADLLSILDRSVAEVGLIRNHWTPADVVAIGRARDIAEGK